MCEPRNEPRLNERDERNLKEIFKLEANRTESKRVDFDGLLRVFNIAGFEPNQRQVSVFREVLDANGGTMN